MINPLKIQIRFSDIDLMGHVNNAVYLNYFESARMHYLVALFGTEWDWKQNGIILRTNQIEYHYPVFLGDQAEVHVYLSHLGTKSFTLNYELFVGDRLCTTGSSVLVSYDFVNDCTTVISDKGATALKKLLRQ